MNYLNIAGYKFVELEDLPSLRAELLPICRNLQLKGTILLAREGINISLAAAAEKIEKFKDYLEADARFAGITYKLSWSSRLPFARMLIRLKKEIITLGRHEINPNTSKGNYITAKEFQAWLDANEEITVLDTRNKYEVALGTFEKAIHLNIDAFGEFPEAAKQLAPELRDKPLVMFCTGGVRCEKAAPVLEAQGFKKVYQLEGGILQYFAECGANHYQGDCFVFDDRIALSPELGETHLAQCRKCAGFFKADEESLKTCQSCPA